MSACQAQSCRRDPANACPACRGASLPVAFCVVNSDTGERYSSTDYESQAAAERARDRASRDYDDELEVYGIDSLGNLRCPAP